jgi:hypothetical protein
VKPLEDKDDGCDLGVKLSILMNRRYRQILLIGFAFLIYLGYLDICNQHKLL